MARQWLRKSELNEKLWKGESFENSGSFSSSSSLSSYCRPALSAESLAKVLLLVVVNSIFLLGALHMLHARREFGVGDRSGDCLKRDRLHNVQSVFLPVVAHPERGESSIPLQSRAVDPNGSSPVENTRHFDPHGVAVHLFVKMSAYRGSANSFAIVGLEAKNPARLYNNPPYECFWIPSPGAPIKGAATKMFPDKGNVYSRLYSAVVINCTFADAVGADRNGGQLVLYASYGDQFPHKSERIVALTETGVEPDFESRSEDVLYDYVYCGSPLFGDLSPQKIREWLAYHARFFGPRAHFFLYDAGGVHAEVRRVIAPWVQAGKVTLDNIREQEKFDGYYHNQFMVVNDCFHRARRLARWLFFFDVDEYLWAPPDDGGLDHIVQRFENQSQIIIWQKPMAKNLCENSNDSRSASSKWTIEKLVFKSIKKRKSNDCKYAIQPRRAMATSIHRSEHLIGANATAYAHPLSYYHFHNTINKRMEVCEEYVDKHVLYVNPRNQSDRFAFDDGLAVLADSVKDFELEVIGPQLYPTAL